MVIRARANVLVRRGWRCAVPPGEGVDIPRVRGLRDKGKSPGLLLRRSYRYGDAGAHTEVAAGNPALISP